MYVYIYTYYRDKTLPSKKNYYARTSPGWFIIRWDRNKEKRFERFFLSPSPLTSPNTRWIIDRVGRGKVRVHGIPTDNFPTGQLFRRLLFWRRGGGGRFFSPRVATRLTFQTFLIKSPKIGADTSRNKINKGKKGSCPRSVESKYR